MSEPHEKPEERRPVPPSALFASILLMAGIWVLLVGDIKRDEMIVGAAGVLVSTFLLWLVLSVQHGRQSYTLPDLAQARRLPSEVLQDVLLLLVVLFKDLFLNRPPTSTFRVCGFKTSKHRPEDVARRVLVTAYSSASPNVIVLGIDYSQSLILFHQLEKVEVSATMRDLGARA